MKRIQTAAGLLSKLALFFSALLLIANWPNTSARAVNPWLSSLPLAFIGFAYAVLQIRLRPDGATLIKRLILAGAFVLWAIDQVLPIGRLATFIGDVVVATYVVDLFWIIQDQTKSDGISPSRGRGDALCSAYDQGVDFNSKGDR
jgi:hypothetical protein